MAQNGGEIDVQEAQREGGGVLGDDELLRQIQNSNSLLTRRFTEALAKHDFGPPPPSSTGLAFNNNSIPSIPSIPALTNTLFSQNQQQNIISPSATPIFLYPSFLPSSNTNNTTDGAANHENDVVSITKWLTSVYPAAQIFNHNTTKENTKFKEGLNASNPSASPSPSPVLNIAATPTANQSLANWSNDDWNELISVLTQYCACGFRSSQVIRILKENLKLYFSSDGSNANYSMGQQHGTIPASLGRKDSPFRDFRQYNQSQFTSTNATKSIPNGVQFFQQLPMHPQEVLNASTQQYTKPPAHPVHATHPAPPPPPAPPAHSHPNEKFSLLKSLDKAKKRKFKAYNEFVNDGQDIGTFDSKSASLEKGSCPSKCTCKKSGCLKMYCVCFANGRLCGSDCSCVDCKNNQWNLEMIQHARKHVMERKPRAFQEKFVDKENVAMLAQNNHIVEHPHDHNHHHHLNHGASTQSKSPVSAINRFGCRCTKSKCRKRYCECYAAGIKCNGMILVDSMCSSIHHLKVLILWTLR